MHEFVDSLIDWWASRLASVPYLEDGKALPWDQIDERLKQYFRRMVIALFTRRR